MLLVHTGTVEEGERFFARHWPEVEAIADPERALYAAFGLGRTTTLGLLDPRTLVATLRAALRGHLPGRPGRDVRQLPGEFVVEAGRVLYARLHGHAGAAIDLDAVARA